jgi:hypothetical protein
MIINDFNIFSGEPINPPEILWEKEDRYALIAFLLLSVDRKINIDELKKFNSFMDIPENYQLNDNEENESNKKLLKLCSVRDTIINEGNSFLDKISDDEDRYDLIVDEVDKVIYGDEKCEICNGYALLGKNSKYTKLPGAVYWLFDYVKLVDDIKSHSPEETHTYSKDKKRLLKHLAHKWSIDYSILSSLETSVEALEAINQKRRKTQVNDMPYRKAIIIIAELDVEEKAIWKELNKLNIAKNRLLSAYVTNNNAIADCIENLGGNPKRLRIRSEDEPIDEDDEDEEETLTDKIGDVIVEGIHKIGDIISAPFDWLTEKIMDRW